MPAPSKTEYASKADDDDNTVCAYKGLRTTVLDRLRASGFDTKSYTGASQKYREVAHDMKASATARQTAKEQYVFEKRKVLRALARSKAKVPSLTGCTRRALTPRAALVRVDWATWLISDLPDEVSDADLDYTNIEDEEEEEMSDDDMCQEELDYVQTVFELCAEILQAQVFVVHQEQEGKRLKDKIVSLEQQLDLFAKAAALNMSDKEALETSAKEAIEQAAKEKRAVEAANVALEEAQRQLKWHIDQRDWLQSFYSHGGPPPPDVMRRMRKLCGL